MNPNDESLAEQAKRCAMSAQAHSIETREIAEGCTRELAALITENIENWKRQYDKVINCQQLELNLVGEQILSLRNICEMQQEARNLQTRLIDNQADQIAILKQESTAAFADNRTFIAEIQALKAYQVITDKAMASLLEQIAAVNGRLEKLEGGEQALQVRMLSEVK